MKKLRYLFAAAVAVAMIGCAGSKADSDSADSTAAVSENMVDSATVVETPAAEAADPADEAVTVLGADDQIIPQDVPVVIDFNATWCGPCQKFAPVFHKVAAEYATKATFVSADTDVCTALAEQYKISSIPAVVIVYPAASGKEPVTNVGFMDEAQFKAYLDKNL